MWQRTAPLVLALAVPLAFAIGCGGERDGVRDVAAGFWAAVRAEDAATARSLTDEAPHQAVRDLIQSHDFDDLTLGETLHNERRALVETRTQLASDGSHEVAFHTHLVQTPAGWRVDLEETRRELLRESLAASLELMREAVRESGAALVEEFQERALDASESLREALEELERDLREGPSELPDDPAGAEPT